MDIGSKIRAERNRKNMTIAEMCKITGLSKGFISNVENNNTSPSIQTLQTIAASLQIPLPYLLLDEQQQMCVVRKNERKMTTFKKGNLKIEHIASKGPLKLMTVSFPPGASTGDPHVHKGVECHLVLEGKVLVEQGEDLAVLEKGDSFSWNACAPHYVENIGDDEAKVLIAVYSDSNLDHLM